MFKKLLPYLGTTLLAVLIYVLGFYTGNRFFSRTTLHEKFIGSIETIIVLNHLDKGEAEKARQYLIFNQDEAILSMNSLAQCADKQTYETACNIMRRIAKHRKENPSKYAEYAYVPEGNKWQDSRIEVAKILQSWESCKNH